MGQHEDSVCQINLVNFAALQQPHPIFYFCWLYQLLIKFITTKVALSLSFSTVNLIYFEAVIRYSE